MRDLKAIADKIDLLNNRLEQENAKMKTAIILLTDAVDEIIQYIVADQEVIERVKTANKAARLTVT